MTSIAITSSSRVYVHLPGRTPRAAIEDFIEPRRSILLCVSHSGFVPGGSQPGGPYVAFFLGRAVSLRRSRGFDPLLLRASIDYTIDASTDRAGWWEARTAGWIYDIQSAAGTPITAFHWHPSSGRVTWPHLHAHGVHESVELHKLHPPTGHVTLSSIVRFLIEDLGVLPRRSDWRAVLDRHADV
jgi:hypothetical protein